MKSPLQTLATLALLLLTLPGCTLGPDYHRPVMETPAGFKAEGSWQESAPRDEQSRGLWWTVFNDPALNELEQKASTGNLEVQGAVARLDQARALLGVSRADRLPRLDFNPSATRGRTSAFGVSAVGNDLRLPLDLGYEIDLWGRVRRSVEAASADADGSLAALESIRLTLQGEVARNYFALRTVDAQSALLQRTIELRRQSLNLVTSLFDNGQIGELDVARARAELAATEAEQAGLQGSRSALENALAVLAGENPSVFRLAAAPLDLRAPAVAPGLPASLLERRPDVAAAERSMAAANARIGVAKTAFFPAIRLTGSAGYASNETSDLLNWDSRTWGLGPSISLPIFSGGRNRANLQRSKAVYEEAVANYRQQVLVAFRDVEDALAALSALKEQEEAQQRSLQAARRASDLSEKRYRAGLVSYLEVVDSQRTALLSERLVTDILGRQLQTTVTLIKSLGGGWEEAAL
jgi:multidrug efflux system outer membrane protein